MYNMKFIVKHREIIVLTFVGATIGYFTLSPFAIVVTHAINGGVTLDSIYAAYSHPWRSVIELFKPYLVVWGLIFSVLRDHIFTVFVGSLGFLIGLYLETRRKYSERLAESYAKLKKLEEMKDSLTHMIIHDLGNPLALILGRLQFLEEGIPNITDTQKDHIQAAYKAGQEMKDMISNLLDIIKMEEGKFRLKQVEIDLNVLLGEIVSSMKVFSQKQEKTISARAISDLPKLHADRDVLKRIVLNLIWNAMKFSPPKSNIEVSVFYKKEEQIAEIVVEDHGKGIPKKYQELIFDKFAQVEGAESVEGAGKGLGLHFCKLAVEAHGGRIWVESEPGKGSVFYFTIPVR